MSRPSDNGDRWDWDPSPEKIEPQEFIGNIERRRDLIAWSFVLVVAFIAAGQMLLAGLAGLDVMEFSDGVLMSLTCSVPIELLVTLGVVVRKVV